MPASHCASDKVAGVICLFPGNYVRGDMLGIVIWDG